MCGRGYWVIVFGALVCAGCGSKEKTTTELLTDLKGGDDRDRVIAVRTLPADESDAARVVPALVESLKDTENDVRLSAAIKLGVFGEQAKEAVPALQEALRDPDARVRRAAGNALTRIDPSQFPTAPKGSAPKTK